MVRKRLNNQRRLGLRALRRFLARKPLLTWSIFSMPLALITLLLIDMIPKTWIQKTFAEATKATMTPLIPTGRFAMLVGLVLMYLIGGFVVEICRSGFRLLWAPVWTTAIAVLILGILVEFPHHQDIRHAIRIVFTSPWLITIAVLILLMPQLRGLVSRLKKAELPGGVKLEVDEVDKIEEYKRSLNRWQRTINDFGQLIERVSTLIENTTDDDRVRFLAYTPALGYLTRTANEWDRLHSLLLQKPNIQMICLEERDLARWHLKFKNKPTKRPIGRIDAALIKKAQVVSESILAEKRRDDDEEEGVPTVSRRSWRDLPGYYLFANSNTAIIATPLFLPDDPRNCANKTNSAGDAIETTPVEMLGFESTDSWTVWMVNRLCERYLTPVLLTETVDFATEITIRGTSVPAGTYRARFNERSGYFSLSSGAKEVVRVRAYLEQRAGRASANEPQWLENTNELLSITLIGTNQRIVIRQPEIRLQETVRFPRSYQICGVAIAPGLYEIRFKERTGTFVLVRNRQTIVKTRATVKRLTEHAQAVKLQTRGKGANAELVGITLKGSSHRLVISNGILDLTQLSGGVADADAPLSEVATSEASSLTPGATATVVEGQNGSRAFARMSSDSEIYEEELLEDGLLSSGESTSEQR